MNRPYPDHSFIDYKGIKVPAFLYGTAWKEDETEVLTLLAANSGFVGIDTANQRRHYHEAGVGKAIKQLLFEGLLQRKDLFLQTKFTFANSQDDRLPYDPDADFTSQVQQSFESSLQHLGTAYLDSYMLHGPASRRGLTEADIEVWRAMEQLQRSGVVRLLGVSNVDDEQLQALIAMAEIKPAFVQNRCFAKTRWDFTIREICAANDIIYQGFSLLTANAVELRSPELARIAKRIDCTIAQIVFRFALQAGMIVLTGTCNNVHMLEDLACTGIELSDADMTIIENIAC